MAILQKIRSFVAVDTNEAKEEAFKQISMINGLAGAEQSLYIPPDMRETNSQTILDSRGRLVSGEVAPEDYLQGDNNLIYPVLSTFWMIVVMLSAIVFKGSNGMSMGSNMAGMKDMIFSLLNVSTSMALVLAVITYLHYKTTEKWFAFLVFALVEVALVGMATTSGNVIISSIAFAFPGIRLIYMNWKNKKDRVSRIKKLSDDQLSDAGASNSIDINQIKLLALDDTPVVPIAVSNGSFHSNGFKDGVTKGLEISLSQKDMTRHMFVCGASGEGKSESMKQFLERLLKITQAKKQQALKNGKYFKGTGWAVFCGKADFPYDLKDSLDGIIKPFGYDPILGKETGYKHFALFKGLSPEKVTSTIVKVNGGGTKSKAGDNKIFDVTGESLTYRSAVALRFLKTYGSEIGINGYKWAPSHLYNMYSSFVERKQVKDSNGNNTSINDNDVLIALRKIRNHIADVIPTANKSESGQLQNSLAVLDLTINFGEKCLNDDIQKFIQSVVATAQSWISSLTENSQLIDWSNTDEDESEIDPVFEIMQEEKRYGWAMKSEELGASSVLVQNFSIERLLTESAIRGKTWTDKKSKQNQFLLIMDEAQDILNESLVKNYAKKVRSWGCSMILMTQNISTLVDRFGKETTFGFLGDIAHHIVLNPKDEITLEYYMKRVGKYRFYKSKANFVPPYDYRATAGFALEKATFDNENPYANEYKKLRTNLSFNVESANKDKNNTNKISTNKGGWLGALFNKVSNSIFGSDDQTNFVTIAQYKRDEKTAPEVYAFDEIEQNKLGTKGQVLIITERGIKRRVEMATMYIPQA